MAKKILLTGASGLLGRPIFKVFQSDPSFSIVGTAFSRAGDKYRKVDITNTQEMTQLFADVKPDVVIHSAAERRPDVVEKQEDKTKALNVDATRLVCELAAKHKAFVVYISTDYLFDGTNPPYSHTAEPNPLNKYGLSKLEGEKVTLDVSKDNIILRVPLLYGDVEFIDESAVTTLFKKVKNTSENCLMSDYERRFPTHCDDVAKVLKDLVSRRVQDPSLTGVFHWSGDENMTKYDMAVVMAEVFGLPTNHIEADKKPSGGAKRPYDAHLDPSRLEKMGICHRTPFRDGIKPCLQRFMES